MIANCTTAPAVNHTAPAIYSPPTAPRLELLSVFQEHDSTYAIVRYGAASRMLQVEPLELETWAAFAVRLADENVVVRHPLRGWKATVENAVRRGAAA